MSLRKRLSSITLTDDKKERISSRRNMEQKKNISPRTIVPRMTYPAVRKRLVVMGATGVGKTSLIARFLSSISHSTHGATKENGFSHGNITLPNGDNVDTEILDVTTGDEQLNADVGPHWMGNCDAYILVFAVDDKESFETVSCLREKILLIEVFDDIPIIIVANKQDIPSEAREVCPHFADLMCSVEWNHTYLEASAKTGCNVETAFRSALRLDCWQPKQEPEQRQDADRRTHLHSDSSSATRRLSRTMSLRGIFKRRATTSD